MRVGLVWFFCAILVGAIVGALLTRGPEPFVRGETVGQAIAIPAVLIGAVAYLIQKRRLG